MSGIFRRPLNQPWFVKFEIVDVRPDRVSDHPSVRISLQQLLRLRDGRPEPEDRGHLVRGVVEFR
jgi:hypothetical protein